MAILKVIFGAFQQMFWAILFYQDFTYRFHVDLYQVFIEYDIFQSRMGIQAHYLNKTN